MSRGKYKKMIIIKIYYSDGVYQLKSARDFSMSLAEIYMSTLLIDHAAFTKKASDEYAALHYAKNQVISTIFDYSENGAKQEYDLVFANYNH